MVDLEKLTLVPEALIVFLLKHTTAFDWVCINCQCDARPDGGHCGTPGGKWQRAQGETGLDVVGRLATPRHPWFSGLDAACSMVVLEAKGDRMAEAGTKINRPAYNEMTGGLAAFFLSNLARMGEHADRAYGWLVPTTFHEMTIRAFEDAQANLGRALPSGRGFLLGTFDGRRFWREAPLALRDVARAWFRAKESGPGGRNDLLRTRLSRPRPELRELAESLFQFRLVRASGR
jgi:hypothetical protein